MRLPWIRIPVDFFERPFILELEAQMEINSKRWLVLVNEACKAGAQGRLVYQQGGELRALTAKQLSRKIGHDLAEYEAFLQLCREQGELTTDEHGFPFLPDWRSYWGALSDAERQQAKRGRDNQLDFGEVLTVLHGSLEANSHAASNGMSRSGHAPVTARDVTVPYSTEQEQDRTGSLSLEDSRQTVQDNEPCLPADPCTDKSASAPEFGESQFRAEVAQLFEQLIRKPNGEARTWSGSDTRKLNEYLSRGRLAAEPDWFVRLLAVRWGLRHMREDEKAHAAGEREKPVKKPLPYALRMADKYVESAAQQARVYRQRGVRPSYLRGDFDDD